ncbi:MAG TPA: ABC transporter permease [Clostridiaceae bacterium]
MNRLVNISKIEFKLLTRNFMNIFFALVFPSMMLLLFGSIYGNEPSAFYGGHNMVDVSVPGYIGLIVAVTGLMTLPLTVAQYRERKILKRFAATPINPVDILISQVIVNFIMTLLGIALLIVIGKIVFDLHFFGNLFVVTFAFILTTFSIFSVGLVIAGVSANAKAATAISYIVYFPMIFLSGAIMPMEIMPKIIVYISKVFPLTYGTELLKGVWTGGKLSSYSPDIIVLLTISIICTLLATKFFRWE